jgi:hypothetical protein
LSKWESLFCIHKKQKKANHDEDGREQKDYMDDNSIFKERNAHYDTMNSALNDSNSELRRIFVKSSDFYPFVSLTTLSIQNSLKRM